MKLIFLLTLITSSVSADVRYNNVTGYWEGNICANLYSFSVIPFQPIGSYCQVILPNGMMSQGQVINR